MAKRCNGEGSIRKRADGRWLVTFPTGLYKDNGKREYIYRYTATQAEAAEALRQLQAERGMGINGSKANIKTGEYLEAWISSKASELAPSTLTSYRNNFRLHLEGPLGEIPLRKLDTYHIQRALDGIGGKWSTFVKNYNIVHAALGKAVKRKIIPSNPCDDVVFPKKDQGEMRVLTKEEQAKFIKELDGEYYRPMLLMYLYSGLRMGEGIPLLWSDIDLESRNIWVNKKAIVRHDYKTHTAKQEIQNFCKTKSSTRPVKITPGLASVLSEHKEMMKQRAAALGEEWSEDSLVFKNTRGNIVYSRNLQESLYKIFARADIKGATMHTLRHTYATRCFEAGVDIKAVSEQLGHADVKTTYNIYVHLLDNKKNEEIAKLNEIDKLIA